LTASWFFHHSAVLDFVDGLASPDCGFVQTGMWEVPNQGSGAAPTAVRKGPKRFGFEQPQAMSSALVPRVFLFGTAKIARRYQVL